MSGAYARDELLPSAGRRRGGVRFKGLTHTAPTGRASLLTRGGSGALADRSLSPDRQPKGSSGEISPYHSKVPLPGDAPSAHRASTSLPSIAARQRPDSSFYDALAAAKQRPITFGDLPRGGALTPSPTKKGDGMQWRKNTSMRQSWPLDQDEKPKWVVAASEERSDLVKLEERFRSLHAREEAQLVHRLETYTAQARGLMQRSSASSALVVCVLDEFASSGGLLSLTAGQEVVFALQVKYTFAGGLGEGGGDLNAWVIQQGGFECVLQGRAVIHADVIYQGAGVYQFLFKPTLAGTYMVSVRLGNGDVPGSPFETVVHAGRMSMEHTTVSGIGLLCAEAGVESTFVITARDAYGNPLSAGGAAWDVTLSGPVCFSPQIVDRTNGTYLCKYTTLLCGDYYVRVRTGAAEIPGSPYVLSVLPGKTHGPSSSAIGQGLHSGFAGEENEFVIEARDIVGNQRTVGDDGFTVSIEGPSTPQVSVFDRDDGMYLVTYTVCMTGHYMIKITLNGHQISGSPFTAHIMSGAVCPIRCTGIGRGLTRAYAGEEARFTVESRDVHRNKTTSGKKPFNVSVRGAITSDVHCIEGDHGEYHYTYRTAKAGVYFVSAMLNGVDIGGSPFKLTVDPGPAHANGCSATGPGVTGGYTLVETYFTVHSRDYYGNTRTVGGDVFNIEIGGTGSAHMRIRDNENGTYTVAYTPQVGGDYFIGVTLDGIHIYGSPFTVASDPLPRGTYLEMFRSLEPGFKDVIEKKMVGYRESEGGAKAKRAAGQGAKKRYTQQTQKWNLNIKLLGGKDLAARDTVRAGDYGTGFEQSSDPYVVFTLGKVTMRSKTVQKDLNPKWNEEMNMEVDNLLEKLHMEVWDEDETDEDDSMGIASISLVDLVAGQPKMIIARLKELDAAGNDTGNGQGTVDLVVCYTPALGNINLRVLD